MDISCLSAAILELQLPVTCDSVTVSFNGLVDAENGG
jgi:hypothetical protein